MSKDFSAITYSINEKAGYEHWSDNLNMIIKKGDVVLELDSKEIIELTCASENSWR